IDDQLTHLLLLQGRQAREDPVVAEVGAGRMQELFGRAADQPFPLFLGEGKAHHGLVARKGEIDDAADAKLHPATDHDLIAPWQRGGNSPDVVDRHQLGCFLVKPRREQTWPTGSYLSRNRRMRSAPASSHTEPERSTATPAPTVSESGSAKRSIAPSAFAPASC